MSLTLCVLLWSHDNHEEELAAYEDAVLALLPDHGATLVSRVRRSAPGDAPLEVQIIELPDEAALEAYLADPRRTALADQRDRSVAQTDMFRVEQV